MKLVKTDNKVTVMVLAIAVVALWGTIIYRIVSAKSNDSFQSIASRSVVHAQSIRKDTFALHLNYDDPFRLLSSVPEKVIKHSKPKKQLPSLVDRPMPIAYHGILKNTDSKEIALIVVSGKYHRVREGERVGQFLISRIYRDSIGIKVGGKTRFIKKTALQ
jgi:hypothetical protein